MICTPHCTKKVTQIIQAIIKIKFRWIYTNNLLNQMQYRPMEMLYFANKVTKLILIGTNVQLDIT